MVFDPVSRLGFGRWWPFYRLRYRTRWYWGYQEEWFIWAGWLRWRVVGAYGVSRGPMFLGYMRLEREEE